MESEDQDLTDHFIQAGKFLKVEVIDHLIISEETYHSFVDSGIFKKLQASERWILPYKVKERIRKEGEKKGKEEGLNEGIQLGKEQGLREGEKKKAEAIEAAKVEERIGIAKALKKKEISMKIIAKTSGLSIEETNKMGVLLLHLYTSANAKTCKYPKVILYLYYILLGGTEYASYYKRPSYDS
ncbi:JAB domain-containing protein [Candidatus Thiosymbion oneisti]|uniref:JAB domain-containing protein n=1 Tax=Candidatus Thiosymbion oneisti TaxID=589554 RepID=UPI001061AFAE|nr:JAB domain-containing protein [Candidatus Thiosymbion oneisti]